MSKQEINPEPSRYLPAPLPTEAGAQLWPSNWTVAAMLRHLELEIAESKHFGHTLCFVERASLELALPLLQELHERQQAVLKQPAEQQAPQARPTHSYQVGVMDFRANGDTPAFTPTAIPKGAHAIDAERLKPTLGEDYTPDPFAGTAARQARYQLTQFYRLQPQLREQLLEWLTRNLDQYQRPDTGEVVFTDYGLDNIAFQYTGTVLTAVHESDGFCDSNSNYHRIAKVSAVELLQVVETLLAIEQRYPRGYLGRQRVAE